MQGDKVVRAALHAGSWYSHNQVKLAQEMEGYLAKAKMEAELETAQPKAIIGPHAGFRYSAPVSAWAYKYLERFKDKKVRVLLMGTSHYAYLGGINFSQCHEAETPVGNLPIDQETISKLTKEIENKPLSKKGEEQEHSLQMHMPFIRKVFKDVQVIPMIVGHLTKQQVVEYGKVFAPYFDSEENLFIISSDFCHWGDNFDYKPYEKGSGQIWEYIQKLDKQGMELIEKQDLDGFSDYIDRTGNTICGQNPIKLLLSTIIHSKQSIRTTFVQYDQSNKVKNAHDSSVSYAASVSVVKSEA